MPEGMIVNRVLSCDIPVAGAAAIESLPNQFAIDATAHRRGDAIVLTRGAGGALTTIPVSSTDFEILSNRASIDAAANLLRHDTTRDSRIHERTS
jgi:hypothetical protein